MYDAIYLFRIGLITKKKEKYNKNLSKGITCCLFGLKHLQLFLWKKMS